MAKEYIVINTPFKVEKPELLIAWIGIKGEDIESFSVNPDDNTQVFIKVAPGKHPEFVKHIPLLFIEEFEDADCEGGCGGCGCDPGHLGEPGPEGQAVS